MAILNGKGMWIWKIPSCEGGDPAAIARVAEAAGFTHVMIKIANDTRPYNVDSQGRDLVMPVVDALRSKGIGVWGWHYVYGYDPAGEAAIAISQTKKFGMDGYIIDAEAEYKLAGREAVARSFMTALRKGLPSKPVALSSYRWPSWHPTFPFAAFLEKCDLNMPQVYWEQAHNPAAQLRRCLEEFERLSPVRPVIPTGCAYGVGGWAPKPMEMTEFLNTARELKLTAANLYSWDYARLNLKSCWETAAAFKWNDIPNPPPPAKDTPELLIDAMNQHNPDVILALYHPQAVHISRGRTIQGLDGIKDWYQTFLNQEMPQADFTIQHTQGSGITRHFTWDARNSSKEIDNARDTIGLLNDKILYHYTSYAITSRS